MQWDDLRFFLSVARAGQIGKAAPGLKADPTTVSRRIRRLERDIGQTLFVQNQGGQKLTPAGTALLARAEAMEHAVSGVDAADAGDPSGLVRVSTSEGFGTWVIARELPHFAALYPGITVDLTASNGFLNPTKRETDLAIMLHRPRRGPLMVRRLTDYTLSLYASRGYLAGSEEVARASLHRHRLIGYVPEQIYAPELDYFAELDPGREADLRSTSINAQYLMCLADGGLAILPDFIAAQDDGLVRVLPDFSLRRSFWLAIHRDVRNIARVAHFTDWLGEMVIRRAGLLLRGEDPT